jgi:SAM-dependent methyltransferase
MQPDLLSQFYESFHTERAKTGTWSDRNRLDFIRDKTGSGHDVLELGCRYGFIIDSVKRNNNVAGCDIDRNAVQICLDKGIDARVMNLNDALDYPDSSFDVVILTEVMEHLPYPMITLAEICRILRPSGRLVGTVPNAVHLRNRLSFLFGGPVEPDPTHLHHFSLESLTATLNRWFDFCSVTPASGRFERLFPTLLSNLLLFCADSPKKSQTSVAE